MGQSLSGNREDSHLSQLRHSFSYALEVGYGVGRVGLQTLSNDIGYRKLTKVLHCVASGVE